MYRNTYVEVDLNKISKNVNKIVKKYSNYTYYIGVVKANCYGHIDIKCIEAILEGGCNYLAVATLDEALKIRNKFKNIPILCMGVVNLKYIKECIENKITITISSLEYLKSINKMLLIDLKVHIKLNTGMNRLGISTQKEIEEAYKYLFNNGCNIEGIYSHIYKADDEGETKKQTDKFNFLTEKIDLANIPIIHIASSEVILNYLNELPFNACRLGIGMYGFTKNKTLNLESTFKLCSEIIQINNVTDDTVGYNGIYKTTKTEKIAIIPIGYADGIIRKNVGRDVFINNKRYKIVGNICMDMLFVKIDESIKLNEKVYLIKDNDHINEIATHLETIPYEILCSIGDRVERKYINKNISKIHSKLLKKHCN